MRHEVEVGVEFLRLVLRPLRGRVRVRLRPDGGGGAALVGGAGWSVRRPRGGPEVVLGAQREVLVAVVTACGGGVVLPVRAGQQLLLRGGREDVGKCSFVRPRTTDTPFTRS